MFRNDGDGTFTNTTRLSGFDTAFGNGFGISHGDFDLDSDLDLDNDGDIDIVVVNKDAPPHLLRNQIGETGNWISFAVFDENGNEAIGATLAIDIGETRRYRQVQRTYSYCASNDPKVHFGLGPNTSVDRLTVTWIGGGEQFYGPFEAGKSYTIRRGEG